jgi:hypothetical protein
MRQSAGKDSVYELLNLAGLALGTGQGGVAEAIGMSRRTMSRWARAGIAPLLPSQAEDLVRAVYPKDAALGERIAVAFGTSLGAAGIAPPARTLADAPSSPHPTPPPRQAEIVICAAAEALDVSPRAVRPAVLAAFRAAREVGLSVADVETALAPPPPAPVPTGSTTRARSSR